MDKLILFKSVFYPESVAVVGASIDTSKAGTQFLKSMIQFGYKGKLYPINPDGGEILGLKAYRNLRLVPGVVDFVYISTPATSVPRIIEDCVAKKVPAVVVFSAGFSEAGETGQKLEEEIVALAKGRVRVIGPNCFGIYCPRGKLTFMPGPNYPRESGSTALISQSGGLSTFFIWAAAGYGSRFSKVISYGNACDLNENDFLDYLIQDGETEVVAAYIEGVKDGKRFFELAKRLSRVKPFILWKGGLTEAGKRAVTTHTGSLGGESATWQAFYRQTGAVLVDNFEEFFDTAILFPYFLKAVGRRVAVVGGGGSVGVAASDACEQVGLHIPTTPPRVQQQLSAILPQAGTNFRNPFDVGVPMLEPSTFRKVLEILLSWDGIDALIIDRIFFYGTRQLLRMTEVECQKRASALIDAKMTSHKPLLSILGELTTDVDKMGMEANRRKVQRQFLRHGIAVSPSLRRALKALSNICSYHERVRSLREF